MTYSFDELHEEFNWTLNELLGDVLAIKNLIYHDNQGDLFSQEITTTLMKRLGDNLEQHAQDISILGKRMTSSYFGKSTKTI